MTISQQIEPHAVLWRHGSWQVRENGLCCSYREIFIGPKELQNWTVAGNARHKLLIRLGVDTLSYAEELDIFDAFDHVVAWFGGSDKLRQILRQSSLDPVTTLVESRQCTEPKSRTKRPRSRTVDYIRPRDRFLVFKRDKYRCQICGRRAIEEEWITLHCDHRVPKSKGGPFKIENYQTLCSECNIGKGNLDQ